MKNVVGPRIQELRHRAGHKVTQAELAARLQAMGINVDRSTIAKIETGTRPLTDVEIIGICKALNIKVSTLFDEP